jgi:hypothetical protein
MERAFGAGGIVMFSPCDEGYVPRKYQLGKSLILSGKCKSLFKLGGILSHAPSELRLYAMLAAYYCNCNAR